MRILALIVLLPLVSFLACESLTPTESRAPETLSIATSLNLKSMGVAGNTLSKIILQVSGKDMDTLRSELSLSGGIAKGLLQVPVGKKRLFTALAYQGTTLVMSGSQEVDIEKGKKPAVEIILNFLKTTLIISPPDTTVAQNSTFTVYLSARAAQNLATFGARVVFDPTMLQVMDFGREDVFLKSNSGSVNQLIFDKDNTKGTIDIVLGIFPASQAVTGNGKVARVVFKAIKKGPTTLSLTTDQVVDSDLGLYDHVASLINSLSLSSSIVVN